MKIYEAKRIAENQAAQMTREDLEHYFVIGESMRIREESDFNEIDLGMN